MEKQQYSKRSLIGRLYLWWVRFSDKPIKEDEILRSCDVRRTVFIEIPVFFVLAFVILGVSLFLGFLFLKWVGFTMIVKILLAGGVVHIFSKWVDYFHEPEVKPLQTPTILADWWDDIYNKVCKPVEWVD